MQRSHRRAIGDWALDNLRTDRDWFLEAAIGQRVRTLRQFAEQEIRIPSGPYAGQRYRCETLPYSRLWFDELDSGRWRRAWATGPSQCGKTLQCDLIPLAYHLAELRDQVIFGLPDERLAQAKWDADIKPMFEASPMLRELLPSRGIGSEGGRVHAITFTNGASLRFMSAGGRDKSRASYTARVLFITEADGFQSPQTTSLEADPIRQLRARLRAYDEQAREYGECTLTTEEGRTWTEITEGSNARILTPCCHCGAWVTPGREHFVGWERATSEMEAADKGHFICPECQQPFSDEQRAAVNRDCRLVHEGQTIRPDGTVTGEGKPTWTLGFRWGAWHNLFRTQATIALDMYRAKRARFADQDSAERELCQFVWAVPYQVQVDETIAAVTYEMLEDHATDAPRTLPRGIVPQDAESLVTFIDLHSQFGRWLTMAWTADKSGYVIDYESFAIEGKGKAEQLLAAAIVERLEHLRQLLLRGFAVSNQSERRAPDQVWIDAGWPPSTKPVYGFCRDAERGNTFLNWRFRPAFGRGEKVWFSRGGYVTPSRTGSLVRYVGDRLHLKWLPAEAIGFVEVDADYWKTQAHYRLRLSAETAGAIRFYEAMPGAHDQLFRELVSEKKRQGVDKHGGVKTYWERHGDNHYLDCLYNCCAAGSFWSARRKPVPRVDEWFARTQRRR